MGKNFNHSMEKFMNKSIVLLLLSMSLVSFQCLATSPPILPPELEEETFPPVPEEPTEFAVSVAIGSNGAGDVSATVNAVRSIVGSAVASGIVDRFIVTSPRIDGSIPIEGGLRFCAEAGFNVVGIGFNSFVDQLNIIAPADGVFYHVDLTDHCSDVLDNDSSVDGTCHVDDANCQNDTDGDNVPPNLPPSCDADTCEEEELPEFPIDDEEFVAVQAPESITPDRPDNSFGDSAESFPMIW
jgi:hypothetical protein